MAIPILARVYKSQPQMVPTLAELFAGYDEWWQWYAIDADGNGHFFDKQPFIEKGPWGWDGGSVFGYKHDMDGVDWQTCIYCRPIELTESDKEAAIILELMRREIGAVTYIKGRL